MTAGDPEELLGVAEDRLVREALESALDAGGDGFALFEAETVDGSPRLRLVHGNAVARAAFGLRSGERLGPCLAPRPSARIWGLLWDAIRSPGDGDGAVRREDLLVEGAGPGTTGGDAARRGPGAWDVTVAPSGPRRAVVTWRDAGRSDVERQSLEETVRAAERKIAYDAVTDLPNGSLLRAHLADSLGSCRSGRRIGVLLCTLNGLADAATARHGREVCHGLLRATADRLRAQLRRGDVAARMGPDTFALVLNWPTPSADPLKVAGRLVTQLDRPLAVRSTLLAPNASVGFVLADPTWGPAGDRDADSVLLRAFEAMQRSRTTGAPVVAAETEREAERARVAALESYDVHDGALDEVFEAAARLASAACAMPYAQVSFVDTDLQWLRATCGVGASAVGSCAPRHLALCDLTVRGREVLVLRDLRGDPRCSSRHVSWQEGTVFYAGAPLVNREGRAIGALCVMDDAPRHLTTRQRRTLAILAEEIMAVLESRRGRRP